MNCRVATCLSVEESATHLIITTNLHGIQADSLRVRLQGEYLIIEGYAQDSPHSLLKRVRYIRHIPLSVSASDTDILEPMLDPRYLEAEYLLDGTLIVQIPKRAH